MSSYRISAPYRAAFFSVALAFVLTGCGGGSSRGAEFTGNVSPALEHTPQAAPDSHMISGQVVLDVPLVGATVRMFGTAGQELASAKTDETGSFLFLDMTSVPRDFVVAASGGTRSGAAVNATLLLVQDDFDKVNSALIVNLPSTLAARLLERQVERGTSTTPASTVARVRAFLDLGPNYDLSILRTRLFDPSRFMAANPPDVLDDRIADMALAMMNSPEATQPYPQVVLRGAEDLAIKGGITAASYGLNLLSQYDDPFSQTVSSWGMTLLSFASGPDYTSRFDQIDKSLADLKNSVGVLQNHMVEMDKRINGRIVALQDRLSREVRLNALKVSYTTLATATAQPRSQIENLNRRYTALMANSRATADNNTRLRMDELARDIVTHVGPAIVALRILQIGSGAPELTSAINVWHRLQGLSSIDGDTGYPLATKSDFFDALNQQQDYIASIQLLGLNLLMDATNYQAVRGRKPTTPDQLKAARSPEIATLLAQYGQGDIGSAQALVTYPRLDPGLIVDLFNGRMFVKFAATFPMLPEPDLFTLCPVLRVRWTESGISVPRALNEPTATVRDCTLPLAQGTAQFNGTAPYGFTNWTLASLPPVVLRPSVTNRTTLLRAGYDFSSQTRTSVSAAAIQASKIIATSGSRISGALALNTSSNGVAFTDSVNELFQIWERGGDAPMLLFSRPYPADPFSTSCRPAASGGIECAGI